MSIESTREFLLGLPRVEETLQWGDNLVYWVLDKAVGGKMFALLNSEPDAKYVLSFAVPPNLYNDLLEIDGVDPAPYFARIHWVAVESWQVFRDMEWKDHLRDAYARTEAKLPRMQQRVMELDDREYRALVKERRAAIKAAAAKKKKK